jgi:hypothetical protein
MVARLVRQIVFMLVAVIMARAQEPFIIGNGYVGVHVFCHTQEYAELLARRYFVRGNVKYLPHKKMYHYGIGTMAFVPLETVATLNRGKETLFVIKVLSTDVVYIISEKSAENRMNKQHGQRPYSLTI